MKILLLYLRLVSINHTDTMEEDSKDPVKEFTSLMDQWESQQGSAASPVPILTK